MAEEETDRWFAPIIVIGGSAGSVEVLTKIIAALPAHLAAPVFVVIHLSPSLESKLAEVLSAAGVLPAAQACDGEQIVPGRIYVARPDHHLLIEGNRVLQWRGPRENRHRPAINALFRSAAVNNGRMVVGVVLSGLLDDGASGLWWVKRHGGIAVVQDPADALFAEMPASALEYVDVDYVVSAAAIGPLLARLVDEVLQGHSASRVEEMSE